MAIESKKPKRQRSDRRKTVEKVAAAVLKKPRGNVRELAKIAGIDPTTVARIKKSGELPQSATKDDRILTITNNDAEIVTHSQRHILREIRKEIVDIPAKDLSTIAKDSAARYMLFRGEATDEHGGAKVLTPDQIALLQGAIANLPG
jgi:transcriptional regulator with XRE-family HTH domain